MGAGWYISKMNVYNYSDKSHSYREPQYNNIIMQYLIVYLNLSKYLLQ